MSTDASLTAGIPDLWPRDVAVGDVLSPATILRYQAGQLRARTRNLLEAEVESCTLKEGDKERLRHDFYVIAPALDRYRYLLFSVEHDPWLVYPVTVMADCLISEDAFEDPLYPAAATQAQFTELLFKVLSSSATKSVIHSLIAKSNEAKPATATERVS